MYRPRKPCPGCGGKRNSSNHYCTKCRDTKADQSQIQFRARRREAGECLICKTPAVAGQYCVKHWMGNTAYNHTGSRTNGPALQRLWDRQGGLCAYTGEKLVPGVNASIDHKIPVSRKGKFDIKNIQWVTKEVNRMKTDLTHRKFLALCRKIAKRH